jgi:hypothetical protein
MRSSRGYALLTVLLALGLLTVSMGVLLSSLKASIDTTSVELKRRQTFYACDGVGRTVTALAQRYFMEPSPTPEGLIDFVCTEAGSGCSSVGTGINAKVSANPKLPKITPAGYEIDRLSLGTKGAPKVAPLPNGPFTGMNARQNTMEVLVRMRNTENDYACETNQELTLGKVSMFQFFVFSDIAHTDLYPGPPMTATGRIHANGNLCFGAFNSLMAAKVTAAGRFDHLDNIPFCLNNGGGSHDHVKLANKSNPDFSIPGDFTDFDPGDRGQATWAADARSKWNGNVLDSAHNVPRLRLPIFGTPFVQTGINASISEISNLANSRFLIDPVLTDSTITPKDGADVVSQKLAEKADIRIIGRDWYLKDPSAPWPGILIHTDNANDLPINSIANPTVRGHHYSYYDRAKSGTTWTLGADDAGTAVLSYGLLAKTPSALSPQATWLPGHRCGDAVVPYTVACPSSTASGTDRLLEGTREGFRDTHADRFASTNRANRFSINIDLAALQEALADTNPGELGQYFAPPHAPFNGIVYVTSDDSAFIANRTDVALATTASAPLTVPIDSNSVGKTPFVDDVSRGLAWPPTVTAPAQPIINAVRVYNARNVDKNSGLPPTLVATGMLPKGITIASNLPMYALGDVNKSSALNPTADWRPILLTGDVVHMLSNNWSDNYAGWDDFTRKEDGSSETKMDPNDNARKIRVAAETTYLFEIIGGMAQTTPAKQSGGLHNFIRFMEDWTGIEAHIRGSLVVGHYPVFSQHSWQCCDPYSPPRRDFGYDTHLDDLNNQPPGAPIYDVQAIRGWTRN